ncbi:ABC-type transport auxiliary lipoprotein family protein [Pseudomarimonas arenosa]|uniref:Membrane integrity-associated transporter subunit PqiC n=1 Tax=Pseudomarimonas arenosa TaxID=2774145 RepID=A0AAW3ZLT6_9GAMM|nr:ABC-type transport auxiliary lipoprotein family protein [Pseudomarimonas arenosa]MBD8525614.1 membrane integrity-associated transporter subunit PqiC [Pseudomarimonas arenosa]
MMIKRVHRGACSLLTLALLAGCASGPGIPETVYYRLPAQPEVRTATSTLDAPLVIDAFYADGVHSDISLLYSTDPEGDRLRAYHYQLWLDPPTRMLQRRLIRTLDTAAIAPKVLETLPASTQHYRLLTRIEAFERIKRDEGWVVRASLNIRLSRSGGELPLLLRDYRREVPADGVSVRDSVRALGNAVDSIYAELIGDIEKLQQRG